MQSQIAVPQMTFNRLALNMSHTDRTEDAYQQPWTPKSNQPYKPHGDDFDDLYDITEDEDEGEEIQIQFSGSLMNSPEQKRQRFHPTIEIPSPTSWPSIHRLQNSTQQSIFSPFSPVTPITADPHKLSELAAKRLSQHSYSSRAPSLDCDGSSFTSEDISTSSCPPTPELGHANPDTSAWNAPVQLAPTSLQTLDRITTQDQENSARFTLNRTEMQQIGGSLRLDTAFEFSMTPVEEDEISALTIPSPGGFFSSLKTDSRNPWVRSPEEAPPTAIAECFYGVPFQQSSISANSQSSGQDTQYAEVRDDLTEGPPTALHVVPGEYNEHYEEEVHAARVENLDRTANWLQSQLGHPEPEDDEGSLEQYETSIDVNPATEIASHAIRLEDIKEEAEESPVDDTPQDTLFLRAYTYSQEKKSKTDAFVYRKSRSEKLRLDRKALFSSHVNQLEGSFASIPVEKRDPKHDSGVTEIEDDSERAAIAEATREQDALDQIAPSSWNVEATKYLNGGTLLTSPTGRNFADSSIGRVLDLGGVATCDWAWQVASEYPNVKVHTVCTSDQIVDKSIAGPRNHKQTIVPNLWTLPFPSGHFDCVSARNVYSILKTSRPGRQAMDEYDLCLQECYRVLRPGGYIEFSLLDADIVGGNRSCSALSVEFEYSLKNRGYDPAPTKVWLRRLRKAGFAHIRRAWLVLPMSQHGSRDSTTAEASHMTGVVGSWAWERWMLKLHKELGREGDSLLAGVPAAFEEGARVGASWRYLTGWARKPEHI